MGAIASKITSLTIVYPTVYLGADQRKHQSSASLAFVRGSHRQPVNSLHRWPVTGKMFPFDDVIMVTQITYTYSTFHKICTWFDVQYEWIDPYDIFTYKLQGCFNRTEKIPGEQCNPDRLVNRQVPNRKQTQNKRQIYLYDLRYILLSWIAIIHRSSIPRWVQL